MSPEQEASQAAAGPAPRPPLGAAQRPLQWHPEALQGVTNALNEHEAVLRRLAEADCLKTKASVLTAANVEQAQKELDSPYPLATAIVLLDVVGMVTLGIGVNYVTSPPSNIVGAGTAATSTPALGPGYALLVLAVVVILISKAMLRFPNVFRR